MKTGLGQRRRRPVDTPAYIAMLNRMIRSAGERVADGDPEDLCALDRLHASLDDAMTEAVAGLRGSGFTWKNIGEAMGTTPQASIMRWVKRV